MHRARQALINIKWFHEGNFFPSLRPLHLPAIAQVALKQKGELLRGSRVPPETGFPLRTCGGRAGRARAFPLSGTAQSRPRSSGGGSRGGPPSPLRASLTEAAPAQRAVAAVQDRAELAQQRGRHVEQERVHRERAAGPAAPRRRRPIHDSVAGDQGPGAGGMRSLGLCTSARCRYTTAEILPTGPRPRRQNEPSQAREGAGPT